MKVTKITYQKVFAIAQYINERIGIEIDLDENDDVNEIFLQAKEKVHSWADEKSQLHDTFTTSGELPYTVNYKEEEPQNQRIGVLVDDILSCTELKILETYRLIKDSKPELKEAYEKRFLELQKRLYEL